MILRIRRYSTVGLWRNYGDAVERVWRCGKGIGEQALDTANQGHIMTIENISQQARANGEKRKALPMNEQEEGPDMAHSSLNGARLYDPFISLLRLKGVRRETVALSGARPRDRILDVCTGTGDVALAFAGRCDDVTGIDLSAGMLAVAQEKNVRDRVRFLRMDATKLTFTDGAFDISAISFALHEMPPRAGEETLREMARVTRKRIVIVDYNRPQRRGLRTLFIALISLFESRYFPQFARNDLGELLARCGLRIEREKPVHAGFVRVCVASHDQRPNPSAGECEPARIVGTTHFR
jgi:ubiquinone/menaquinone biosynthesis C-methylase UbiE